MATKVKPCRIQATGTPQAWYVPKYVDEDTFQWWAGWAWSWDVIWPASSTDWDVVLFDWATWKLIKDSSKKLSDYQTALSTQTAYTSKWTSTAVATITTNTLWQVTGVTETNIAFPVTSVNGNTGAVTWLQNEHTATTVTLAAANWSSKSITVSVTWVTATNTVIVSPAPSDFSDYTDAEIYCSAQGSGTLTFTCSTEPTNDIDVNVVILS